ncbi:hypothetical protein P7H06_17845 [Paenibacillus larvae]|nr:hypothetical protein [Paenibacillus larvae]MDT2260996.1 hypothetical protein [Paenibacillus larvae]
MTSTDRAASFITSNTLYLEEVIRSAIGLLKEEEESYLDDLLDHRKKGELAESTAAYKEANLGCSGQNKLG